jgi:hypothetical protein
VYNILISNDGYQDMKLDIYVNQRDRAGHDFCNYYSILSHDFL